MPNVATKLATNLKSKPQGFAKPKPAPIFRYRAEINNRFHQTDNSELFLGEIFFSVPEQPTREDTHSLAVLYVGCWLQAEMAVNRGANQAFLFTANSDRYIERIEVQAFDDKSGCHRVPINNVIKQERVKNPLLQCKMEEVKWQKYASSI